MTAQFAVTLIELDRVEGYRAQATCRSLAGANAQLREWAATITHDLGYDKVKFRVFFNDGSEYAGRFDLKKSHQFSASLKAHMIDFIEYVAENPHGYHSAQEAQEAAAALVQYRNLDEDTLSAGRAQIAMFQEAQPVQMFMF